MVKAQGGLFEEIVSFDSSVFDAESVKRAAYRYIDRFAVDIKIVSAQIVCILQIPEGSRASTPQLIAEFRKEVLDQDLRRKIAAETAVMRNTILSIAFSAGNTSGRE